MYARMLISQRMNKHLLNMFSIAGSFDGDSILKIRLGAMLHGESQMNHVTSGDMYIYIYIHDYFIYKDSTRCSGWLLFFTYNTH